MQSFQPDFNNLQRKRTYNLWTKFYKNGHCDVNGRGSILVGIQATLTENWWKGKIEDPEVEMYQFGGGRMDKLGWGVSF